MISEKLKQARTQKGFSQEKLATESGLSLRTVQRVENAETDPQGDTLMRLARALDMTPDDLLEWDQKEDTAYLAIMNISALSFLLFPLLGVILPLILWVTKKDEIKRVGHVGKQIINFQITWVIVFFAAVILNIVWMYYSMMELRFISPTSISRFYLLFTVSIAILYGYNIIVTGINVFRASKEQEQWYHPQIPFIS
jgi:transcriptional regulator with XRE-family HTH domain